MPAAAEALREANDRLEYRVRQRTEELAVAKERAESADRLNSPFSPPCRTNCVHRSIPSLALPGWFFRNWQDP